MALRPAAVADWSARSDVLCTAELPHDDRHRSDLEQFVGTDVEGGIRGVFGRELLPPYGHAQTMDALYLLTPTANAVFARRGYEEMDREDGPGPVVSTEACRRVCPAIAVCMWKPWTADASSAGAHRDVRPSEMDQSGSS